MNPLILGGIFDIGKDIIKRVFKDPEQQAKAELELAAMQQEGKLKELAVSMSAIIAEAQSADPWTSRARPSFLYVVYVMILSALPFAILYAFKPEIAIQVAAGLRAWLAAIPDQMWWLFGAGYLGYTGARSYDKGRGQTK